MLRTFPSFVAAVTAMLLAFPAASAELAIGTRAPPAVDPHYQWLGTNEAYSQHMFEALVRKDAKGTWLPALATSWRQVDELTWDFTLRKGVKFHDGSEFTAEDVVFTFNRVPNIPNNPNPYTVNIRPVAKVETPDPYTARLKLSAPDPLVAGPLSSVFIVSHAAAKDATPADFQSGKAAIGTGPYKFVSYTPDDRLVLARNDAYWGGAPAWDKVTFRIISNDASRVAALRAGDVDVIDFVPPADVKQLEASPNLAVHKGPSARLMYLVTDAGRPQTPDAIDAEGKPMAKNPMLDPRVRRAMALAIDRAALVSHVMEGAADPANEVVPEGTIGYDPAMPKLAYDPDGARKLLADAGYPNGFGLGIHCSSNRYVNDGQVCQAIGQMLSRVGLKMKVETLPLNVYFPKVAAPKNEFSLILMGWDNTSTNTARDFLTTILHTYDTAKRLGQGNRAYYSDATYDRMVEDEAVEPDATQREVKMRAAVRYITETFVAIPLHVQYTILASRRDLVATPRIDEQTLAMEVRPAR